jgi:RNA polymerase sigma-70 factor (ECF subfamily)
MAEGMEPALGYEGCVRPHLDYLYGVAIRLCGNRTAAEDLLQDALLRAFRAFASLRDREHPRRWLTRVLTSAFYDRVRVERSDALNRSVDEEFDLFDKIAEEDPFPYSDRLHLDFLDLFDDTRILEVLRRLVPQHRVAVILAYVYGFTAKEIGEMTGRPVGTVLSWLHRGRKQLERELWEYAVGHHLIVEGRGGP